MISQNKDPVYMRQYLEYVVQFEKYVWVWTNAMNTVNNQLQQLYKKRNSLDESVLQGINESNSINAKYQSQTNVRKKDNKKFLTRILLSTIVFVIIGIVLLVFGNTAYPLFGLEVICLIFGIYNISKYFKNKKRISEMEKFDLNSASEALISNRKIKRSYSESIV